MLPPTSHKNLKSSSDLMSSRRKLILISLALIAAFWFFTFKSKDLGQFNAVKQSMHEYEELLRETREQILERLQTCQKNCYQHWDPDAPIIYIITPTYTRPVQKAELTRLSHTLMLVNNIHWIIVEDAPKKTSLVESLLYHTGLNYTHLNAPTPEKYKRRSSESSFSKPRGVEQRNAGISWLRVHRNSVSDKGVVYFADDDNTYTLQIFDEMRFTKEVSVWPVGLVGGMMVEKPVLNTTTGKVIGWNSMWRPDRKFPIDMAGFAVNLHHLISKPKAQFRYNISGGFLESDFLQQLTTRDKLEPMAQNCTKVLVWHTRTEAPRLGEENKLKKAGKRSDVGMEV